MRVRIAGVLRVPIARSGLVFPFFSPLSFALRSYLRLSSLKLSLGGLELRRFAALSRLSLTLGDQLIRPQIRSLRPALGLRLSLQSRAHALPLKVHGGNWLLLLAMLTLGPHLTLLRFEYGPPLGPFVFSPPSL